MRALFITHNIPRFEGDAAGSFVLRLAVALQQQGVRVDVIAPGAAGLADHDVLEGVPIARVRYASDARMTLAYTGTMAEAVRETWAGRFALVGLLRAMRRAVTQRLRDARRDGDPYDVVHVHWWFPSGLALWRAFKRGHPPIVLTMHGSDVRIAQSVPSAHPLMRAVLAEASVSTVVSNWLGSTVARIAPNSPVDVAPKPVDIRLFAVDESTTARDGILFVGRLNAQKGLAALLDALAMPALAHATLDVVGDGPDRTSLHARAESLGVSSRVRWHTTKRQAELVPWYRGARCVAIPSSDEGLGLVAVEAQLCGTPVVAYASGGLTDVVRAEAGGSLVAPGDVAALALALAALLNTPEDAHRRGILARNAMLKDFAPTVVAARYAALYRRAINDTA